MNRAKNNLLAIAVALVTCTAFTSNTYAEMKTTESRATESPKMTAPVSNKSMTDSDKSKAAVKQMAAPEKKNVTKKLSSKLTGTGSKLTATGTTPKQQAASSLKKGINQAIRNSNPRKANAQLYALKSYLTTYTNLTYKGFKQAKNGNYIVMVSDPQTQKTYSIKVSKAKWNQIIQ